MCYESPGRPPPGRRSVLEKTGEPARRLFARSGFAGGCAGQAVSLPGALRSGPIYHAEGLEDPLLMPRGLVDQNV